MELILIILIGLLLFDLAAWRWGIDSTDDINSPEWERRKRWHAAWDNDERACF
jgi:hypothetical protein